MAASPEPWPLTRLDVLREFVALLTPEAREALTAAVNAAENGDEPVNVQINKQATAVLRRETARRRASSGAEHVRPRAAARPRERRERRHVARSTSSQDGGDEPPAVSAARTRRQGRTEGKGRR